MTADVLPEPTSKILKQNSFSFLPVEMSDLVVQLNEDGVTTTMMKKLAQSAATITVTLDNQDQVLAAVNILHAAGNGLHEQEKKDFYKEVGRANPSLLRIHDVKHPRYRV